MSDRNQPPGTARHVGDRTRWFMAKALDEAADDVEVALVHEMVPETVKQADVVAYLRRRATRVGGGLHTLVDQTTDTAREPDWMQRLGRVADDLWQRGDKKTSSALHELRAQILEQTSPVAPASADGPGDPLATLGHTLDELLVAVDRGTYRFEPVHVRADLAYLRAEVANTQRARDAVPRPVTPTSGDVDALVDEVVDLVLRYQGAGSGGPHAAVRAAIEALYAPEPDLVSPGGAR